MVTIDRNYSRVVYKIFPRVSVSSFSLVVALTVSLV